MQAKGFIEIHVKDKDTLEILDIIKTENVITDTTLGIWLASATNTNHTGYIGPYIGISSDITPQVRSQPYTPQLSIKSNGIINGPFASTFTGSISGTTMTITAVPGTTYTSPIVPGMAITGTGVSAGTYVTAQLTGLGGVGTYSVSVSQTVASTSLTGTPLSILGYVSTGVTSPLWVEKAGATPQYVQYQNRFDAPAVQRIINSVFLYSSGGTSSNVVNTTNIAMHAYAALSTPCIQTTTTVLDVYYRVQFPYSAASGVSEDHYRLIAKGLAINNTSYATPAQTLNAYALPIPSFTSFGGGMPALIDAANPYAATMDEAVVMGGSIGAASVGWKGYLGATLAASDRVGKIFGTVSVTSRCVGTTDSGLLAEWNTLSSSAQVQPIFNHSSGATSYFLDVNTLATGSGLVYATGTWTTPQYPEMYSIKIVNTGNVGASTYVWGKRNHLGFYCNASSSTCSIVSDRWEYVPALSIGANNSTATLQTQNTNVHGLAIGANLDSALKYDSKTVLYWDTTGVTKYNFATGTATNFDAITFPAFTATAIQQVSVGTDGSIWMACANTGLWTINPAGTTVTQIPPTGNYAHCYGVDIGYNGAICAVFANGYYISTNNGSTWTTETVATAIAGTITPGSGYTNGVYANVPLTGGTGTGAVATVYVVGGVVQSVIFTTSGTNYTLGDSLTTVNTNIGGTGSGFAVLYQGINESTWNSVKYLRVDPSTTTYNTMFVRQWGTTINQTLGAVWWNTNGTSYIAPSTQLSRTYVTACNVSDNTSFWALGEQIPNSSAAIYALTFGLSSIATNVIVPQTWQEPLLSHSNPYAASIQFERSIDGVDCVMAIWGGTSLQSFMNTVFLIDSSGATKHSISYTAGWVPTTSPTLAAAVKGTLAVAAFVNMGNGIIFSRSYEITTGVAAYSTQHASVWPWAPTGGVDTFGYLYTQYNGWNGTAWTPGTFCKGTIGSTASVTASISGTTMIVSGVTSGVLVPGQTISGTGVTPGTTITSSVVSATGTGYMSSATTLVVVSVTSGTFGVGQVVSVASSSTTGPAPMVTITALGTGTGGAGTYTTTSAGQGSATSTALPISATLTSTGGTGMYTVSASQTVASTTITATVVGGGSILQTVNSPISTPIATGNTLVAANTTNTTLPTGLIVGSQLSGNQQIGTSTSSSISGYILTVGGSTTGTFQRGQYITGAGIAPNTMILSNYATFTFTQSGTTMTVTNVSQGALGPGMFTANGGGTVQTIVSQLTGIPGGIGTYQTNASWTSSGTTATYVNCGGSGTYLVNIPQTVAPTAITSYASVTSGQGTWAINNATSVGTIGMFSVAGARTTHAAGYATVTFTKTPVVTPTTPLGITAGAYTFTATINGGTPTQYSVTATGSDTMQSMAALIQSAIGSSVLASAANNQFIIASAAVSGTSSVSISAPGTGTYLFQAIATAIGATFALNAVSGVPPQSLGNGISVNFTDGIAGANSFVSSDWYSFGVNYGILKDNATTMSYNNGLYWKALASDTTFTPSTVTLQAGATGNPVWGPLSTGVTIDGSNRLTTSVVSVAPLGACSTTPLIGNFEVDFTTLSASNYWTFGVGTYDPNNTFPMGGTGTTSNGGGLATYGPHQYAFKILNGQYTFFYSPGGTWSWGGMSALPTSLKIIRSGTTLSLVSWNGITNTTLVSFTVDANRPMFIGMSTTNGVTSSGAWYPQGLPTGVLPLVSPVATIVANGSDYFSTMGSSGGSTGFYDPTFVNVELASPGLTRVNLAGTPATTIYYNNATVPGVGEASVYDTGYVFFNAANAGQAITGTYSYIKNT